ncbi:hypothetical protein ACFWIB_10985 [Streptomyces sp. NPDC127051]|uniref:hypothetical protein n=1 Tax=Streptomyces sp. NPDC127051 TaxID=3347119 RepID=UPI003656972D
MTEQPIITVRGLLAAVALLTAQASGLEVEQATLLGDTPAEEALRALTMWTALHIEVAQPRRYAVDLQGVGTIAAQAEVASYPEGGSER